MGTIDVIHQVLKSSISTFGGTRILRYPECSIRYIVGRASFPGTSCQQNLCRHLGTSSMAKVSHKVVIPLAILIAACFVLIGVCIFAKPVRITWRKGQRHYRSHQEWLVSAQERKDERRRWAVADLEKATVGSFAVDEREVDRFSDCASTSQGQGSDESNFRSRQCSLTKLPAELRIKIYSHLDYGSALGLTCTDRFFYRDAPAEAIPKEQRATYVWHAETFMKNKDRLACFSCLRLLGREWFAEEMRKGRFAKYGDIEFDRVCWRCELNQNGTVTLPSLRPMTERFKIWPRKCSTV